MSEFEEAKAFLMKDQNGSNLFDHVSDVLLKVLIERPADPVATFEQLSAGVKQGRFMPSGSETCLHDPELVAAHSKEIAKLHRAEGDVEDPEDDEDAVPLPPPRADVIADLNAQANSWKAAGIQLDDEEMFKLQLSLARLAGSDDSIQTLRLWGKLLGTGSDYYVAEGTGGTPVENPDEDAPPAEAEANKHTYWICKFAGGPWTQLPEVRPEAVICARQIKRYLTGDVNATVLGYPAFPGPELLYIRAMIALISADCAIAPRDYFKLSEEGDAVELEEEYTMPAADGLASAEGWQTYGLTFSSLGRVTPLESEDEEGNVVTQPEGWETQLLRDVNPEDWTARVYPRTLEASKNAKVVLRSERWPGAYAVAAPCETSWTNIYVGYGHSKSDVLYTPPMPPQLQREFDVTALKEQEDVIEDPTPPEVEEEAA